MLARMAGRHLDKFNAQALANTAWAFATVGQQDEQPFKALARMAERRLEKFNAQGLANMAWAFATMGPQQEKLFNAQGLANTAWALAVTDSAALHARELGKRSSRGGSWGGWVIILFDSQG